MKRYIVRRTAAASAATAAPAAPLKPLVMPPDEAADKQRLERAHRLRELAWTHLEYAHTRCAASMDAQDYDEADAYSESLAYWMRHYTDLTHGHAPGIEE